MDKCEAGCKVFTGGEIRHHPDCVYYPESLSKMYDDKDKRIAELQAQLADGYVCDVCAGDPTSVENCACNGTGQMHETVVTLRKTIFELEAQVEALNSPVLKSEWQEQLDRIAELEAQLANVKIEVANRVARGDFIRYQHLQAILEDKP